MNILVTGCAGFIGYSFIKKIAHTKYKIYGIDNFLTFKIYCGIKITGLNPFLLKQDKEKFESAIPRDNRLNQVFLFRIYVYRIMNKILKVFFKVNTHKKRYNNKLK